MMADVRPSVYLSVACLSLLLLAARVAYMCGRRGIPVMQGESESVFH